MNKKYLVYILSIMFLMVFKPSFSMYGAFFKAARAVGVSAGPVFGLYNAYNGNKSIEDFDQKESTSGFAIEEWGKEKIKQLKVSNAESISFVKYLEWATNGKRIGVPPKDAVLHESIRLGIPVDDQDKKIALQSMCLKHEVGHIVHSDTQNGLHYLIGIPVGIEAISFGATKGFRKLCNIQSSPKTFIKTMLRSCSAMGAIVPKMFVGVMSILFLKRQKEMRADQYMCEHAESRLELEAMADDFREREKTEWLRALSGKKEDIIFSSGSIFSTHPSHSDRREQIETYLAQWDREHAQVGEKRA
jgi:hypothetical protein